MPKHNGQLSWLNEVLLGFILPKALSIGGDELKKFLQKAHDDNPVFVETTIVSLYPFVDVYLEKYAGQTETKFDDKAVSELMETLEEFAADNSIDLPNLDED
jgi:hypothetical protein